MVTYLRWVVAVLNRSTRSIRSGDERMRDNAGHIEYSVSWCFEIIATVYWSVELLTVCVLRLELEWTLLEGGGAALTNSRLLREVVPRISVLSSTLRLMQKSIISHWLIAIMRTCLRSTKIIIDGCCSNASTSEHGPSTYSDPILILGIGVKIRIYVRTRSSRIASYAWCHLN